MKTKEAAKPQATAKSNGKPKKPVDRRAYVTVHVGIEVREEMNKHPKVNWSKVARRAFCRKMGIEDPSPMGKAERMAKEIEELKAQLKQRKKAG